MTPPSAEITMLSVLGDLPQMGDQFQCPFCRQLYALTPQQAPHYAGRTIPCSSCGRPFLVPQEIADGGPPAVAAAPPPPPVAPPPPPAPQPALSQPVTVFAPPRVAAASPPPPSMAPPILFLPPRPRNAWATASIVLALIGMVVPVIFSLLAIILGFIALHRTHKPRVPGRRMAQAGVVIGFLGLAVGIYVLSVAATVFERVRERGRNELCERRLRAIGQAMLQYAAAHDGRFPDRLQSLPPEALGATDALVCPSADQVPPADKLPDGRIVSYLYAGSTLTTTSPAEAVLLYEPLAHHRDNGMNVLFADGRVRFITAIEASKAIERLKVGRNPPWTGTK